MTRIKWREVFKFLSGATLAGSFANFYLWLSGVSVPFLGYTITPRLLALRAAVQFGFREAKNAFSACTAGSATRRTSRRPSQCLR